MVFSSLHESVNPRGYSMGEEILTAVFAYEKATKNTFRFEEQTDGQPPKVGTLYVQKWAFKGSAPQKVTVTVSTVE